MSLSEKDVVGRCRKVVLFYFVRSQKKLKKFKKKLDRKII